MNKKIEERLCKKKKITTFAPDKLLTNKKHQLECI